MIYDIVRRWIFEDAVGTGSAEVLANLVLALYNGREFPFGDFGVAANLDDQRRAWAMELIHEYWRTGESDELVALAREILADRGTA